MRTAPGLPLLGAVLIGLACASSVRVQVDPGADFSRYRTWNWLPGEALVVHSPSDEVDAVRARLERRVAETLALRGFERVRERPDLRVGAVLVLQPGYHVTSETGAVRSLTSHHETAFEVQATESRVEEVQHFRLEVYVSERQEGRVIWQAQLSERNEARGLAALDGAVERLLANFPRRRALASASAAPPAP